MFSLVAENWENCFHVCLVKIPSNKGNTQSVSGLHLNDILVENTQSPFCAGAGMCARVLETKVNHADTVDRAAGHCQGRRSIRNVTASSVIDTFSHVSVRIMGKQVLVPYRALPIPIAAHPFCSPGSRCWRRR